MALLRVLLLLACLLIVSEVTLSGCPPPCGPSPDLSCSAPWQGWTSVPTAPRHLTGTNAPPPGSSCAWISSRRFPNQHFRV